MAQPTGGTDVLESTSTDLTADTPWQTLLWNDPVNLAEVVTHVLTSVLKCGKDKAESLMLIAHTEGKTAVTSGTQEECQQVADALGS